MTDNNEEVGFLGRLSDMIAAERTKGGKAMFSYLDGTFILDNSDHKKDVEVGDTLIRDISDGSRDLKVYLMPKLAGNTTMSDGSQEPLYSIVVRRRRLDLGE